jgi:hypothetical protein
VIRIKKPKRPPEVLRVKGVAAAEALCDAYVLNPGKYDRGELAFDFDGRIYRHPSGAKTLRG